MRVSLVSTHCQTRIQQQHTWKWVTNVTPESVCDECNPWKCVTNVIPESMRDKCNTWKCVTNVTPESVCDKCNWNIKSADDRDRHSCHRAMINRNADILDVSLRFTLLNKVSDHPHSHTPAWTSVSASGDLWHLWWQGSQHPQLHIHETRTSTTWPSSLATSVMVSKCSTLQHPQLHIYETSTPTACASSPASGNINNGLKMFHIQHPQLCIYETSTSTAWPSSLAVGNINNGLKMFHITTPSAMHAWKGRINSMVKGP